MLYTSNRGLCGAFNSNVIKETRTIISEKYAEQYKKGNLWILPIGKKGYDFFRKTKVNMLPDKNNLLNDLTFEMRLGVAEEVMESFVSGEFDRVELIYNKFKNAAVQNLTDENFFLLKLYSH